MTASGKKRADAPSSSSPTAQVEAAFGKKKSLYDILGVKKDATAAAIRKAYFRVALTCHPDKCQDDPSATAKFQALSIVHATLSDEGRRRHYDETGEVEEEEAGLNQSKQEWYDYWRNLFPTVTLEQLQNFQAEYQTSDEEKQDVFKAYVEFEGNMAKIIDNVMLAVDDDEPRFRELIEDAINAKEVKRYKAFKAQVKDNTKRKAKAEKEAKETEELMKMIQAKRGPNALANMAADRKRANASFLDALEEKYTSAAAEKAGKKKKTASKGGHDDIDAAEFERIQASLKK